MLTLPPILSGLYWHLIVVYFDQQTGAMHAVHWLKSIFDDKTIFYVLLSHKMYKMTQK